MDAHIEELFYVICLYRKYYDIIDFEFLLLKEIVFISFFVFIKLFDFYALNVSFIFIYKFI